MSSTGIRAGRAFVEIGASDKFSKVLDAAKAKLNSFAAGAQAMGQSLGATGLAMGAPIGVAAAMFTRFDDAMRAVGGVTRASEADLASMTETAAELGRTTSFTAVEVANLMTELGRAGFSPTQINEMTAAVLDLSRATGTDAALAAGIVASTLRQFGMDAVDAARASDVLTMAANSTFNTVEGLGESLKYAGPVAADLGMSLEDTVAILGALGNVGIQGSEAGTALRRLSVIAAATGAELKSIFGIDNVDAAGNLKPLVQIMDEIGAAVESLPVAERVAKMEQAFGLLGITSASVLTKTGDGVAALSEQLRNASGTAAATATAMDAGAGGAMRRLSSAAEGTANALGKNLETAIIGIGDAFSRILADITAWIEKNQTATQLAAGLAAGLIGTGAGLIALSLGARVAAAMVGGLQIVMGTLGMVMTATTAVINFARVSGLLLTAAMAAQGGTAAGLTAAMVALNAAQAISPVATGIASAAFTFLGAVLSALAAPATLAATLAGVIGTAWTAAAGAVSTFWATVLAPLLPFVAAAAAVVAVIGGIAAVVVVAAARAGAFAAAWEGAKRVLGDLLAIAKETFGGILAALQSGDYAAAVNILWAGIKAAFWTGIDAVLSAWSNLWDNAWDYAKAFGSSLLSTLGSLFKAIPKLLWSALSGGASLATIISDALSGNMGSYLDTVKSNAASARGELSRLTEQTKAAGEAAKVLAEQEKELATLKAAAQGDKPPEQADPKSKFSEQATAEQKAKFDANQKEIAALRAKLEAEGKALPPASDPDKAARLKEDTLSTNDPAKKAAEAVKDRIASLEDETRKLIEGEKAAERYRLAQDGATEQQLKALDAAQKAKDAAEVGATVKDRIAALNEERLAVEQGTEAVERAKLAQLGATAAQLEALKAAQKAADEAKKRSDMRDEGDRLRTALRNPLEVFRAELEQLQKLKQAGAIDAETFSRAASKAKEDLKGAVKNAGQRDALMAAERKRIEQLVAAGKVDPEAAQRFLTATAALLDQAVARAEQAGPQLSEMAAGTFDGFGLSRMLADSGGNKEAARTAAAAEATAANTANMARKLDRIPKPPKFQS